MTVSAKLNWMAYSELPWRPFLGHQVWSWTTLRRGNVFYYVYKRFFLFLSRFLFLFERFTSMIYSMKPKKRKRTKTNIAQQLRSWWESTERKRSLGWEERICNRQIIADSESEGVTVTGIKLTEENNVINTGRDVRGIRLGWGWSRNRKPVPETKSYLFR